MSCDALTLHVGSCLSFEVSFTDSTGSPIDITGDDITIEEATDPVLSQISITKTDPANGKAKLHLSEIDADMIPLGVKSNFRIGRNDGECLVTTNMIWIDKK